MSMSHSHMVPFGIHNTRNFSNTEYSVIIWTLTSYQVIQWQQTSWYRLSNCWAFCASL